MTEQGPFSGLHNQIGDTQGRFMQRLHPLAALIYVLALFVLVMLSDNPLYLLILLVIIGVAIKSADGLQAWERSLVFGLVMTIVTIVINGVFIRAGDTILWHGPKVPVLGKLDITMEAVFFGIVMGLRLLAVISVFVLYNCMVHPDKILSLFARFTSQSALVLAMSSRLFPLFRQRFISIQEVQLVRGVDYRQGSYLGRLRKYAALFNNLLATSLEDAMEMAEAMQARGYGAGKRTRYRSDIWRPRDSLVSVSSVLALLVGMFGFLSGYSKFEFYPVIGYLITSRMTVIILALLTGLLLLPLAAGWGWHRWNYLKSKI